MKGIKIKIFLILLMLVPVPYGCKDKCQDMDDLRYVLPYWQMQDLQLEHVNLWYINTRTGKPMFGRVSNEFENHTYSCENMALYIVAPNEALRFHAQNNFKSGFSFSQEAFACNRRQPGYDGTLDLVYKIYISSNYDFSETHLARMDMSDIVDIFAYTNKGDESWMSLEEYNRTAPHEAPKRFHLLIKRPARLSNKQQFVIRFLFHNEPGEASREFEIKVPDPEKAPFVSYFNVHVR